MKTLLIAATVAALGLAPAIVNAQAAGAASSSAAPAAKPYYSTTDTTIGDLLDNPATKAVLQKHVPDMVANPQIDQARGMTLKAVQQYAPDMLTDKVLAEIDADLAQVPAPKS